MTRQAVRDAFFGSSEWNARVSLFTNPNLCP